MTYAYMQRKYKNGKNLETTINLDVFGNNNKGECRLRFYSRIYQRKFFQYSLSTTFNSMQGAKKNELIRSLGNNYQYPFH